MVTTEPAGEVGTGLGVADGLNVGVPVGVGFGLGVPVAVGMGLLLGVPVLVGLGLGVREGVGLAVPVGPGVGLAVPVGVGPATAVNRVHGTALLALTRTPFAVLLGLSLSRWKFSGGTPFTGAVVVNDPQPFALVLPILPRYGVDPVVCAPTAVRARVTAQLLSLDPPFFDVGRV